MTGIDIKPDAQGKVRDLYDLGDKLLLVATDRISAFDYILEDEIPHKGAVLTQLSCFWFELLDGVVENHLISSDVADLPEVGTYVVLGLAYVCIIGALYVDFSKIRKVRRAYQEEMMSKKTKEMRAAEKQQKAAQRAAKQKVEEAPAVEEAPKKRGLFGNGFRLPKKQEAEPMEAKTSDKDSTK